MLLTLVIVVFVVVAITIFTFAASLDDRNSRSRLLRERLRSVETAAARGQTENLMLLRDELLSEIPALNRLLSRSNRMPHVRRYLAQADAKITAGKFLLICACMAAFGGSVTLNLLRSPLLAMIGFLMGLAIPVIWVSQMRSRRFHKFEESFPEAIRVPGARCPRRSRL